MMQYEVSTLQDFEFINAVFRALDEAVECAGLFKYQHVSSGNTHNYIVTCPRVCNLFDFELQNEEYPYESYYREMLALGFELQRIVAEAIAQVSAPPATWAPVSDDRMRRAISIRRTSSGSETSLSERTKRCVCVCVCVCVRVCVCLCVYIHIFM